MSAGYLRLFGENSIVMRHSVRTGLLTLEGVAGVGRQFDYWGSNRQLSDAVEQSMTGCEATAIRILRSLDTRWPVSDTERVAVVQFVAIHVARTPTFRIFLRRTTEEAIEERVRPQVQSAAFHTAANVFRGDGMHANALLRQISRIACVLASMQWSLVRFDSDCLITSDQPVVVMPLKATAITPASAMPESGFADTIEIRFPVDPRTLLLLSWAESEDHAVPLEGSLDVASNVNCSTRAQAFEEWFFRPGTRPCFLAPPLMQPQIHSAAPYLLPPYGLRAAIKSGRRQAAEALMTQIVEDQDPTDPVRWVVPRAKAA